MSIKVVRTFDFIMEFDDVLDRNICRTLIKKFRKDKRVQPGRVISSSGQQVQSEDKLTDELAIEPQDDCWREIHEILHQQVTSIVLHYIRLSPSLQIAPVYWTGYKIKKYAKEKGYFKWHFDALGAGANDRQLALILYLNDVDEGGATQFHHQNLAIQPKAGKALLFPTAWTHLHCGQVPRSCAKYIITSFVKFDLSGMS